jgi:hypothetical protein
MRREDSAAFRHTLAEWYVAQMTTGRNARLLGATALFSLWLVVLLAGSPARSWIHLVLGAALVIFPWRALSIAPRKED